MAFGKLSIGVRVWDGTGPSRAVLGLLSGKPGSSFPRLEHCWQTIRVAPSTRDRAGLPTISLPQTSQYNGCYKTSWRRNSRNRLRPSLISYRKVLLTYRWIGWLRGIDSGDYRRRRIPLHSFNCSALRLGDGRPGTCEPHPSPPGQVNSRCLVPVHYGSTVTAPEFAFQSLVRLESLPASRTSHTGTSGLAPRQTDNR